METIGHWIDGAHREGTSGRTATVWNPASGEPQSEVSLASVAEVDAAVDSAKSAFARWSAKSLAARTQGDVPLPRAARWQPESTHRAGLPGSMGRRLRMPMARSPEPWTMSTSPAV